MVVPQSMPQGKVLVGLGANSPGPWGTPRKTLRRALKELEAGGLTIERISELYETAAMGQPHQPPYFNAVILGTTTLPAPALLRLLKDIEARAGRRGGGRPWGMRTPRPRHPRLQGFAPELGRTLQGHALSAHPPARSAPPGDRAAAFRAAAAPRCRTQLAPPGVETERGRALAARAERRPRPRAQAGFLRAGKPGFALPGLGEPPK